MVKMMSTRLERLQDTLDWLSLTNPDHAACAGERSTWEFEGDTIRGYNRGVMLWAKTEPEAVEVWWLAGSGDDQGSTKTVIVNLHRKQVKVAHAEDLWRLGADPTTMLPPISAAASRSRGVALQNLYNCNGAVRTACDQLTQSKQEIPIDPAARAYDAVDGLMTGSVVVIQLVFHESGDTTEILEQKQQWWNEATTNLCRLDAAGVLTLLDRCGPNLAPPVGGSRYTVLINEGFDPRAFAEDCGCGIYDITIK